MVFSIKYFVSPRGHMPLLEFLNEARTKDPQLLSAAVASISLMRDRSNWGGKLSKKVRGNIYEIKADSSRHFGRMFYCTQPDRSLLIFNGYMKTTNKTNPRQIAAAEGMELAFNKGKGSYEVFTQDQ